MDGQLGLMPTRSGWQTVRVENGKPITLPQLIFTGQTQIQFCFDGANKDPAWNRADVSKIIGELGDTRRSMNALVLPLLLVTERLGRASSWSRYAVNRGTGYPVARPW
jgi:hypothetical protein